VTVKALFLDRDGVINLDNSYVCTPEDFCFMDGIIETLMYFQDKGYLLIIITNQSGIGRGYYTEARFHTLTEWMLRQFAEAGVHITKVYFSPYHPEHGLGKYKRDSFCRKPNPGMIVVAQKEFGIDLGKSLLVGDRESDIEAGINAGVKTNVLLSCDSGTLKKTKATVVIADIKELITCDMQKQRKFRGELR
jgi:D-glycero-D-manno-heptose 1,7-bisphosphate phosphatase